jgi:hypothetical protein
VGRRNFTFLDSGTDREKDSICAEVIPQPPIKKTVVRQWPVETKAKKNPKTMESMRTCFFMNGTKQGVS